MPTPIQYAQDFLAGVRGRLSPEAAARVDFSEGSKWDALAGGLARVMTRLEQVEAEAYDAHILERAVGSEVDAYCEAHGPVRRLSANKAKGAIAFHRPSAVAGGGYVPSGAEVRVPCNGSSVLFVAAADTPIAATATYVSVPAAAAMAGKASSVGRVAAGLSLTGQPGPLFDATLLPTSIDASGGVDIESDAELKARQRAYEQGKRGGTIESIRFAALSTPGVKHVVLASRYGVGSGGEGVAYVGDANWYADESLCADVARSLESWRAFGPSVNVRKMLLSKVASSATISLARSLVNYDQARLRALVVQKALDYFATRVDPYAWSATMLGARMSHADDEIVSVDVSCTVGGVASSGATSPLTIDGLVAAGGFPALLTVYSTDASLVSVQFEGS